MKYIFLFFSFFLFYRPTECLYEDQVGSFDWHKKFVGHVTWSSLEQSGRRKVLLGNGRQGIIAAVNAGPGTIAWRQELGARLISIVHHQSTLITLSGDSHVTLRAWHTETGLLKWEVPTPMTPPTNFWPLSSQWRPGGVVLTIAGSKKDQLVVASDSVLSIHSLRSGKELWSTTLSGRVSYIESEDNEIQVWYTQEGEGLRVEEINLSDRKMTVIKTVYDSWIANDTYCILTGESVTCWDPVTVKFYYLKDDTFEPLETEGVNFPSLSSSSTIHSITNSQVLLDSTHILSIEPSTLMVKYLCTDCAMNNIKTGSSEDELLSVRVEEEGENDLLVSSTVGSSDKKSFIVKSDVARGGVVKVDVFILNRPGELVWRALVLRQDSSISFISSAGELVWTREEGLADIVAVETVDLPSSESLTEDYLSLLEKDANPLLLFFKRINFQISLLQDFVQRLLEKGVASLIKPQGSEELLRDDFNTRKIIIAVTSFDKVYGIDSNNGCVIWQLRLLSFRPLVNQIYILRSSLHAPHPPLAAIVGVASHCTSGSFVYEFNPISGKLTNQNCLLYDVTQAMLLSQTDHAHQRKLLFLDTSGQSQCYPSGCGFELTPPMFMYTVDISKRLLVGVVIKGEGLVTKKVWQSILPQNEKILAIVNNHHGHTHSLGRVRADRSVQYKYINPNLVAIATEATDQTGKSNIHIYLIDGVNGGVVHHVTHKLASGPVNIVICENWIIYTLYNIKSYRYEISVLELYDPRNQTESIWSSLATPVLPLVTSQSYSFLTSVLALSYTVTHKGITNKNLLLGLSSGHILSLDKNLLDPRRNITPTQEAMEDGLLQYLPEILIDPRRLLNYNKTVTNIRSIFTTSTGLESTSLIFAYGQDLYSTRVTPSKQFDVLAEDFDYKLIALVVGGLVLATVVTARISARKTLNLLWQ